MSPGVSEPVSELGAPSTHTLSNPNSRWGRSKASPYSQGRVMEQSSASAGVRRDRRRQGPARCASAPVGRGLRRRAGRRRPRGLVERLAEARPSLVVLEATGGFEATVAAALAAAGLPLAVVNPRQIRDFARATGRLAKTDSLDAEAIARFAEAVRPEPRPLPDAAARAAHRAGRPPPPAGRDDRQREPAPPPASRTALVRRLEAHLAWLQKELAEIDSDLDDAVRGSPAWRATEDLLASVPGHRPDLGPPPDRRAARARPARPAPDRQPGRRRPGQPRQRRLARPAHGPGRSRRRPHRPVHAHPHRHPLQPRL